MKIYVILFCIQFSLQNSKENEQLKISIYYEALCPYSSKHIKKQLYPTYKKIGSSLMIDLVPYGLTTHRKVNGKWEFECHHGPKECLGNKAQACGLAENKGRDKNVDFVHCIMGEDIPSKDDTIIKCGPKLGVLGDKILSCSHNGEGDELLAKLGNQTHAFNVTVVPTIVFNDKFEEKIQSRSLKNLLKTACDYLNNKPAGCK